VIKIHDDHTQRKTKLSSHELSKVLSSLCASLSIVYFVIDALDELPSNSGVREQLLRELRSLQADNDVRLLFTSRHITEVAELLNSDPSLEIRATQDDVMKYIDGQMHRLPRCIRLDEKLRELVRTEVARAVDGM
jgi:hypothetical protein